MKVTALLLAITIILMVPLTAYATPRTTTAVPQLIFDGTTATCQANVAGNSESEYITVTMRLWRGNRLLETWTADGYGYVFLTQTATVTQGKSYRLAVNYTINGVNQPQVYIDRTC